MSAKQYIALQAIQLTDAGGVRHSIEPRSEKASGLFEHDFDARTETRLLSIGAIRAPEGTEKHEDPTNVDALHDSRETGGDNKKTAERDPDGLDAMKVDDLRALADREVIDLGEASKKADIIAAIRKARADDDSGA